MIFGYLLNVSKEEIKELLRCPKKTNRSPKLTEMLTVTFVLQFELKQSIQRASLNWCSWYVSMLPLTFGLKIEPIRLTTRITLLSNKSHSRRRCRHHCHLGVTFLRGDLRVAVSFANPFPSEHLAA